MSRKHYGKQTGRPITHELSAPAGGMRLETFVPWTLVKRGYKKQVITPLDAPQEFLSEATREREARAAAQDTALMRALGLAYPWQRLLDEQRAARALPEWPDSDPLHPYVLGRYAFELEE
jgi:hypothetical protein